MKRYEVYYPGFTKKALTFSIDDGRVEYDSKLIDIVKHGMIKGAFNLSGTDRLTPDEYRSLYSGFEIANHCKYHPYAFEDGKEYNIASSPANVDDRDPEYLYPHPQIEDLYYLHLPRGWRLITTAESYIRFVEICHTELEEVFGEGSVRSYVWPFNEQNSSRVKEYLRGRGYYGIRKSGLSLDSTGFSFPEDKFRWICNANHTNLLEVMEKYEAYPNDGELKMFCFGVHSSDYEISDRWSDLSLFTERYGNRPSDFWYATVGEIFDYYEASRLLRLDGDTLVNGSNLTIYATVDGVCLSIAPGERVSLAQ